MDFIVDMHCVYLSFKYHPLSGHGRITFRFGYKKKRVEASSRSVICGAEINIAEVNRSVPPPFTSDI